ncbi:MAG: hypothetical protein HeimC3_43470 [Candidatus Heimdallarchaeota archaeon LC_3]|nr:MAG: hypothetical protein HeimC3_43470 [Candidatus Heimdallarchaeota archaeon LC_3]
MQENKNIIDPFNYQEISDLDFDYFQIDNYSARIASSNYSRSFSQRLPMKKYDNIEIGLTQSDEVLLGRDWQEKFNLNFQKTLVKINPV